jgi:hypothetical protein
MSDSYPWYDSWWLTQYVWARKVIQRVRPQRLSEFIETFAVLRTRHDFTVKEFSEVLSGPKMQDIADTVAELKASQLKWDEFTTFGRRLLRNHPFITELQQELIDLASDAAGEPVEPAYNFLSLYTELGVCPVHMDAPEAKWTLDLCIRQSEPWPIHLSQVVPWPEDHDYGDNWEESIKNNPGHRFSSYSLEPGNAIFFSGSSQWHYRDALSPAGDQSQFCDLVFFHFIPKGMSEVIDPRTWARCFGVPELIEHKATESSRP